MSPLPPRAVAAAAAVLLAGGCGRTAPAPAAPEPAPPPARGRLAPEDEALVAVLGEAKRRLAADRAVVANRVGYEQAVARLRRDMEGTGMARRVPEARPSERALRQALDVLAVGEGLTLVELALGEAPPAPPVPAEHRGEGPYDYAVDQVIARVPVTLRLAPADPARLARLYRALPGAVDVMLDLDRLAIAGGVATLSGHLYHARPVTPPRHVVPTPDVAALARAAGVDAPAGHPRLPEVRALLDSHRALAEDLAASMRALGEAHLLEARLAFYRERARAVEGRPLPAPAGGPAPGPADATP